MNTIKRDIGLIVLVVIGAFAFAALLDGCAGQYVPPVSVSGGFFGATVTVSEPGFTVPAKVVPTNTVSTPTLMVPVTAPVMTGAIVPVTTATGQTASVPVVATPSVTQPILAVPTL